MAMAGDSDRRLSALHIFKIYYPDLFGGILSVIRDVCAALKGSFNLRRPGLLELGRTAPDYRERRFGRTRALAE
jgi:hypothetical protein